MYWVPETRYNAIAYVITIAYVMSRNCFDKLRTKAVRRDHEDFDKLFKIRHFVDAVRANIKQVEPEKYNSIDEPNNTIHRSQ